MQQPVHADDVAAPRVPVELVDDGKGHPHRGRVDQDVTVLADHRVGEAVAAELGQLRIGLVGGEDAGDPGQGERAPGIGPSDGLRHHMPRAVAGLDAGAVLLGSPPPVPGRPQPPGLGQVPRPPPLPLAVGARLERAPPPVEDQAEGADPGVAQQLLAPAEDVPGAGRVGPGRGDSGLDCLHQLLGAAVTRAVQPGRGVHRQRRPPEGGDAVRRRLGRGGGLGGGLGGGGHQDWVEALEEALDPHAAYGWRGGRQ